MGIKDNIELLLSDRQLLHDHLRALHIDPIRIMEFLELSIDEIRATLGKSDVNDTNYLNKRIAINYAEMLLVILNRGPVNLLEELESDVVVQLRQLVKVLKEENDQLKNAKQ